MERTRIAPPPQAHVTHVYPSESKREGILKPTRIIAGLLLIAALALVALPGLYGVTHEGRVFNGVSVLGRDLGGMSRSEAQDALQQASTGYSPGNIPLSDGARTATLAASDLGVTVDVDRTLDQAMSVGRGGNFVGNLGTQLSALFGGTSIKPVLKYDSAMLDKAVAQIAAVWDRPAVNSTLKQDSSGAVQLTASSAGKVVDQEATRKALEASLASAPFAMVSVTLKDDAPRVTEASLQSAKSQAMVLTQQPLVLKSDSQEWTLEPADLQQMLLVNSAGDNFTASLDQEALSSYLTEAAAAIKVEPTNASVVVGNGAVTLNSDESGVELDVPAAISAIEQAAQNQDAGARTVELPLKEVPATITTAQVQAVYDQANGLVTQGLRLYYGEDGYILRNSSVTGFIDVAPSEDKASPLKLVIDEDVLANRISGVAYNFNRNATDARFRMVDGTPTKVGESKDGIKVDVDKSLQTALAAISAYKGGARLQVALDVAVTPSSLHDADISTINTPDLLGTGQTSYANSSAARAANVELGASKLDGALIPPGAVFSTDDTLGPLTLDAGFKMGYGIVHTDKGLSTVPAEAGGICQVSTTLFHSVFWSGLPIVERHYHSYWISLYGVAPSGLKGLDATISPPDLDFRFKNTTGHWILVRAATDKKTLTVKLYGVNPGWKVSVKGPVISNVVETDTDPITEENAQLPAGQKVLVEHAQDGFTASIHRTVTNADGNVIDDWTARSAYEPAHNRYLVGTGK